MTMQQTIDEMDDVTVTRDRADEDTGTQPVRARVERADTEAPYLPDQTSAQAGERWQRVQAEFVDDPRKSVSEAHELVSELVQRIVDGFSHERDNLEQQWSKGDSVSTEDLRVCLQRYRTFFSRLLPSANGMKAS